MCHQRELPDDQSRGHPSLLVADSGGQVGRYSGESNAVMVNNPTLDMVGVGASGQDRRTHFYNVSGHLGSSGSGE